MVNLNAMDFSKQYEWDGQWTEGNEWDGLLSEEKMKSDQWSW